MVDVLQNLRSNKKPGVKAMDHERPSSNSPRRSSSLEKGIKTRPRLTGGISGMLCVFEAGGGGEITVTDWPSGRRTPPDSTTTPFCTRPWITTNGLLFKT